MLFWKQLSESKTWKQELLRKQAALYKIYSSSDINHFHTNNISAVTVIHQKILLLI